MLATISTWILSIAGVVCLSVIVELILPNGQMAKYIKGIFSFIIILVIIMPIPKLFKMNFDFSNVFNTDEIHLQEDYLYQLNLNKILKIKTEIEDDVTEMGYQNVVVSINADIFASSVEFKSVSVDLRHIVITPNAPHMHIVDIRYDIVGLVQKYIEIEEGVIYFDE